MSNKLTNPEVISRKLEPAHMSPPIFVCLCVHMNQRGGRSVGRVGCGTRTAASVEGRLGTPSALER